MSYATKLRGGTELPGSRGIRFVRARRGVALLAGIAILALSPAQALAEEGVGASAGYGIGSALCSLIYAPTKIVYATLGSVVGGFAWLFSAGDNEVASAVITPSSTSNVALSIVCPGCVISWAFTSAYNSGARSRMPISGIVDVGRSASETRTGEAASETAAVTRKKSVLGRAGDISRDLGANQALVDVNATHTQRRPGEFSREPKVRLINALYGEFSREPKSG